MDSVALKAFHPLVAEWFLARYGRPTPVQEAVWPLAAAGESVLLSSPTGSGKTLAAFLSAIDRFARGASDPARMAVLYVSPLKALNADVRLNLLDPLARLEAFFAERGAEFPRVAVQTRSGDTTQSERQRMVRKPPSILITTPESLSIILNSPKARDTLATVETVIVDEVHAVAAGKRGVHLAAGVERLSRLVRDAGGRPPQRIAVSATVRPMERVAALFGIDRIVEARADKEYRLSIGLAGLEERAPGDYGVRILGAPGGPGRDGYSPGKGSADDELSNWPKLVEELLPRIERNRSTLVFVNSRRHAERVASMVCEAAGADVAYAHHGSLSRELRHAVERRLKQGSLKCIVATSSLELGIDIGSVDEVVMVGAPPAPSQGIQRMGRAGHGVGQASVGRMVALNERDLLECAAAGRALRLRAIEELRPPDAPLDLLAQIALGMVLEGGWTQDSLYAEISSWPCYRALKRADFDGVVGLLAGRYAEARLRELKPRIRVRDDGMLEALDSARLLLYRSAGTIADRGYYKLRAARSRAVIGELDEEFVWERRLGDTFSMGSRNWRIVSIDDRNVDVEPSEAGMTPFWKADAVSRDPEAMEGLLELVGAWEPRLGEEGLPRSIAEDCLVDPASAERLVGFLKRQRAATGLPLPGPGRAIAETACDPERPQAGKVLVLHTLRGLAVNAPLAIAMESALEEAGFAARFTADNDCVLGVPLEGAEELPPAAEILRMAARLGAGKAFRAKLEASGTFGAAFRECAETSLALPRAGFGERVPLWVTRMRAKRLREAVAPYGDFPVLAQAWRECLGARFDMPRFRSFLDGVESGGVEVLSCQTSAPSPFCGHAVWLSTNKLLYEEDDLGGKARGTGLSDAAIEEALERSEYRPRLAPALLESFIARASPPPPPEPGRAGDWLRERLLLPADCDAATTVASAVGPAASRLRLPGASVDILCAAGDRDRIAGAFGAASGDGEGRVEEQGEWRDAARGAIIREWLGGSGPARADDAKALFGLTDASLDAAVEALDGRALRAALLEGSEEEWLLLREDLEILLRMRRKASRRDSSERPASDLPAYLAAVQGLRGSGREAPEGREALERAIESLAGLPLRPELWERCVLPLRCRGYGPELLDALLRESPLVWARPSEQELLFSFDDDLPLWFDPPPSAYPGGLDYPEGVAALALRARVSMEEAEALLMADAARGAVSADGFAPIRRMLQPARAPRSLPASRARPGRGSFAGMRARAESPERWFALAQADEAADAASVNGAASVDAASVRTFSSDAASVRTFSSDAIDREELQRERVRAVASRWGIVCPPLLERELPGLRFSALERSIRRLELSGELVAGSFFRGLRGPQLVPRERLELFDSLEGARMDFILSAQDPASPCGLELEGLEFPARLAQTWLCFAGGKLALVAKSEGRELESAPGAAEEEIARALGLLRFLLERPCDPLRSIGVETVDGEPAPRARFRSLLLSAGFRAEYRTFVLER